MPKLKDQDVERNQVKIEDAALRVFTRQGYHGTSVREIAQQANVSLGNIYNYYRTKEEIFESLVHRYGKRMASLQQRELMPLLGSLEPDNLGKLASVVREIVSRNSDYWRLMYIDVVEFGNKHFAHLYQDFPDQLKRMNPEAFGKLKANNGIDPAIAFAGIYLQFFLYYLVETLFGGKQHLGVPEDQAIGHFIRIATAGVGNGGGSRNAQSKTGGTHDAKNDPGAGVPRTAGGTRRSR